MIDVLSLLAAQAAAAGAPVPQLECAIRMRAWCIARFDGTVQLSDDGQLRRWSVTDRIYMRNGPLIIIEPKTCDAIDRADVRRIDERRAQSPNRSYISIRYSLSEHEQCLLEFQMPLVDGAFDPIYRQFMLYNVFINGVQLANALH